MNTLLEFVKKAHGYKHALSNFKNDSSRAFSKVLKLFLILLATSLSFYAHAAPSTLSITAFSAGPFCQSQTTSLTISYAGGGTAGNFNGGNTFTAQLSDASGSFTSPTTIGTSATTTARNGSVTISITIPAGAVGTGYRIRLRSSNPGINSSNNNGSNIIVNARPTTAVLAIGTGASSICNGSSANLKVTISGGASPYSFVYTGAGGGTVNSYTSAANFSVSPTSTTSFGLTSVTDNNGCTATTPSGTPSVTVTALPTVNITGNNTINIGTTTTLSPTTGGTWASNAGSVASVNSSGVVTGVASGSATFTFTSSTAPNCSNTTSAVAVANILNNVGLTSSTVAITAHSVRKLSSTYTGFAMEVRRSSDNATANVAFNGNEVDASSTVTITAAGSSGLSIGATMSFSTFYASTSCFVETWYDQSGNGRDASQVSTTKQPRIINNGVFENVNGKKSVYFAGTSGNAQYVSTSPFTAYPTSATYNAVTKVNTNSTYNAFVTKTNVNFPAPIDFYFNTGGATSTVVRGDGTSSGFTFSTTGSISFDATLPLSVWSYQGSASLAKVFYNDAVVVNDNTASVFADDGNPIVIGSRDDELTSLDGWISEAITFATVSSGELTNLHANQMPYFNFYPTITAGTVSGTIASCLGSVSASPNIQQFTVSGGYLTNDVTLTAPTNFQISTAVGTGYTNSITLTKGAVSNAVVPTIIYVRAASTAPLGAISGNVTAVSSGATTQNIAVSGTVNALPVVSITGTSGICVANTTTLSPASGGTWASSNAGLASVTNAGVVTGVAAGSPTFTFTSSTTPNCSATTSAVTVIAAMTVTPGSTINLTQTCSPAATPLTGASVGGSATNGSWSITSGTGTLSSTSPTVTPSSVTYTPLSNTVGAVTLTLTSNSLSGCNAVTGTRTINIANATPTIANYLFNAGTNSNYGSLTNSNSVTGITVTPSGPSFNMTATGVVTGGAQFTTNGTAGNYYTNTTSLNATPLDFTLTSSTTPKTTLRYKSFKVYYQARTNTGTSTLTLSYNLNGTGFVTTGLSGNTMAATTTFQEELVTIPVAADQPTTSLAFRIQASNATAIRIDNFQVEAEYVPITDVVPAAVASTICSGNSTNIQIANSELGVNYQLRNDADNSTIGAAVAGTGGTINLSTGNLSSTRTFNVLASDGAGCSVEMSTVVTVTVNAAPTVTITNPASVCSPTTVDLTAAAVTSGSTGGLTYTYWTDAGATASLSSSNAVNTTGTYYIKGTAASSCFAISPVNVTVNATPSVAVTASAPSICTGGSASITANSDAGNAVSFSGTGQYVQFSSSPLQGSTDFTFEAMIYWTAASDWQRIFDIGQNTTVNMFLTPQANDGRPRYAITTSGNGGEQQIISNTTISLNAWHHIAVTLSGTTGTMYIDGVSVGTNASMTLNPSSLGTPAFNYLGESQYVADPTFAGSMDEIRFWNVARTLAEINANKSTTVPTNSTNLTAYYRMNEGSGTSLVSVATGGPTGTTQGGATWTTPSTAPITAPMPITYAWSPSTGLNTTSGTTVVASPTNGTTAATTTTYTVTGTYSNGCFSTATSVVTINPVPVVSNQTVTTCSGTAFTVTPTGVPTGTTYTWSAPTGTGFTGGSAQGTGQSAISQTLTNSGSTPVTATYTVTPTSGTCSGSSFTVTVTVNPLPSAITGLTGICRNSTTAYASTTVGGTWSSASTGVATITTAGVVTGVAAGSSVISYTLGTGCAVTRTITVNASTGTIVSLTPSVPSICLGSTTTLSTSASTTGGTWSSSNTNVTVTGGTTATNVITGAAVGTAIVNWSRNNGTCNVSTTSSVTINARPTTAVLANGTGLSTICNGSTINLKTTITGGLSPYSVVYTGAGGGTVNAYTSGADFSVSPTSNTTFGLTSVTDANGCTATSPSGTPTATVHPRPTFAVLANGTGSSNVCNGVSANLKVTVTGGTGPFSFVYTGNGGGTITNYTSAADLAFTPSSTTVYGLTSLTDANGCTATTPSGTPTITIKALPVVSITGSNPICGSTTTQLSPTTGGSWVSNNAAAATVVNSGLVTGTASGGTATFTFTESATTCSNTTTSVTVNGVPATPIISGTTNYAVGGSFSLTASSATGGSTFTWTLPGTATGVAGASTSNITKASVQTTERGSYTVIATNSGCNSASSAVTTVTVGPSIFTTGTLSGLTTVYGTASATTTFSLSAVNITQTSGVSITAPAGFQLSTSATFASNVGSTITLGAPGTIASTPIYVRLAATTAVGSYSGNITCSSTGALSVNVATLLSTVTPASLTITANNTSKCFGNTATFSGTEFTSSGLLNSDAITTVSLSSTGSIPAATVTGSPYSIVPSAAVGTGLGNYSINYVNGVLTVNALPSISVDPSSTTQNLCLNASSTSLSVTASGAGLTYQWYSNASAINTGGNLLSGQNASTYSPPTTSAGTTYYYVSVGGTCAPSVVSNVSGAIVVKALGTWLGTTSDWSVPSNWCGAVPTASTDVVIPTTANNPVIPSNYMAYANNLAISTGAGLTSVLGSTSTVLQISGNWSNAGTFVPNTGTVEFVAAGSQSISNTNAGTENFYNLTIAGSGTKSIASGTNVNVLASGTLTLGSGVTFDLASQTLTLKSNAPVSGFDDNTARLATVPTGATFANASNFRVERYIPSGKRTVRFLSSPVSGATVADWNTSFYITGTKAAYPDNATLSSTLSTVTDYTESLNGLSSQKFTEVYGLGTVLVPGKGYRAFIRGGKDIDTNPLIVPFATATTLSVKGTPNVGDITRNLTFTSHSKPTDDGWNLVGNPYASAIDWDLLTSDVSNLNIPSSFSIFDPRLGTNGAYYSYSPGVSVPARANPSVISSSQSFFVKMTAAGSITFKESHKTSGIPTANFRVSEENLLRVTISDTGKTYDETALQLLDGAFTSFDKQYDAYKMKNSGLNIYTISSSGDNLSINRYPTGEKQMNIPLAVSNTSRGEHKLRFNDKGSFGDQTLYLQDTYLKKYMKISEGAEYPFTISTDANSSGVSRFLITNAPAGLLTETETQTNAASSMAVKVYPSPTDGRNVSLDLYNVGTGNVKVTIMDLTGRLVYSTDYGVSGVLNHFNLASLTELANGMYLVNCQTGSSTLKTTFTISK